VVWLVSLIEATPSRIELELVNDGPVTLVLDV
jgi:hypothetical protein